MNFIDVGLQWFEEMRDAHAVELVQVTHRTGIATVAASVIDPNQSTAGDGVRVKSDHFLFIVSRKFVANITIQPGVKFTRKDGSVYEVVTSKLRTDEYNDSNRLSFIYPAKLCS